MTPSARDASGQHASDRGGRPAAGRWLSRILARFARDRRGVTAVEFALISVPFFGLICGLFEVALVNFNAEQLQAGVAVAARQLLVGNVQGQNITSASQFRDQFLCPTTGKRLLPPSMDCTKLIIDLRVATSFATADTSTDYYATTPSFCPGKPGDIAILRVIYPMPSIFPMSFVSPHIGLVNNAPNVSGWAHLLMGSSAFQEEPYGSSYTPPNGC